MGSDASEIAMAFSHPCRPRWFNGPYWAIEALTGTLKRVIWSGLVLLALTMATGSAQAQADPEKWMKDAEEAYGSVSNYTAIFHMQQQVGGKLNQVDSIFIKFRKPYSLYMRWISPPDTGCELLYVDGWNKNRARVHSGGFFRFITRDLVPTDARLMVNNLRPCTDTGLGYVVKTVGVNVRKAIQAGEFSVVGLREETLYGRKTQHLEVVFPRDKAKGYDAYRFILNQDVENKILISIQMYDWDDHLLERYGYEDLKLNAGLTDTDFVPGNAEYHF